MSVYFLIHTMCLMNKLIKMFFLFLDNMDDDEQRTMTRFMQMINDLRSSDRKHIDFGDNLFRLTDVTTTAPPIGT